MKRKCYISIYFIFTLFFSQRFSRAPDPVPADLQVRPGNGQLRHVDQAEDSLLHRQVLVVVVDATVYRKVSISRHFHFFADKKHLCKSLIKDFKCGRISIIDLSLSPSLPRSVRHIVPSQLCSKFPLRHVL